MSDDNQHAHEQSLAFVAQQGKVKNFALSNNAELVDHSKMESIANLEDAAVVAKNAPNYVEKPEQPIELQKGPPKKVIALGSQTDYNPTGDHANNNTNANANNQEVSDNLFGDDNNNDNTNNNPNTNNNDTFDGFLDDMSGDNDDNSKSNAAKTMIHLGDHVDDKILDDYDNDDNDDNDNVYQVNNDEGKDDIDADISEEVKEDKKKETFLSVWQEQRRKYLLNKAKEEREKQQELRENGTKTIKEFHEKTKIKREQARKNVKGKEDDLRADFDSVFKNGSIWVQVARLVNLQTKDKQVQRMKNLLIQLKNEDDKKE